MSAARRIAEALAAKSIRSGGGYLVPCPVTSHGKGRGDRNVSLHVSDGDEKLLVHCFAGCDARDILDELRRRGLLDDRDAERDRSVRPTNKTTTQAHDDYAKQQHQKAAWLWSRREPIIGTIAETYLRKVRGISSCALPATLGFLPSRKPEHHPAMIAAFALADEPEPGIVASPRDVAAIHLTLLKPDGSSKADVAEAKLMVGSPGPTPVVLAPVNDLGGLAITEGIEDALSVHEATGLGAWAAGAAGRMPGLASMIPRYAEAVTICAHADKAGRNGARQLAENIARIGGIKIFVDGVVP